MKSTLITLAIITFFTFSLTSCQKTEEAHYVIKVLNSVDSVGYLVTAIDKVNRDFEVGDTVIIERAAYSASAKWVITNDTRLYNIAGLQSAIGIVKKKH